MVLISILCGCLSASAVLVDYPWPATAPTSTLYRVRMWQGGVTNTMYTHYSEPNLTQGPDGDGVTGVLEDRSMSYVQYAFSGEIEVEVTKLYGTTAPRVEIAPKAYGINPHYFDGRTVRFRFNNLSNRIEYISVNFVTSDNQDADGAGGYDIKNGLMLFGDEPETDVPDTNVTGVVVYSPSVSDATLAAADLIYFPPGEHDLLSRYPKNPRMSSMPIGKNGQQVYAAGGAFIKGAIHGNGKDGLRIYGRGIFTGQHLWWHAIRDDAGTKDGFMEFMGTDDSFFEGVVVENPTHHTWPSAKRNTYHNVKVIGWASNHDGLRPAEGSLIDGVFIKTCDDLDYARGLHTGANSVIWPMRNGAFGQLGWNNLGTGYTTYTNLYFINPEWHDYNRNRGVIGSVLNQGVHLESNVVENIYCENHLSLLANVTVEYDGGVAWDPADPGEIRDFTFRNVLIESFTAANGAIVKNPIHGFERNGAKAMIRNFRFINIVADNQLVTDANASTWFDIDPNTTSNITFTTAGSIHTVTASAVGSGTLSPSGSLPTPEGMTRTVAIVPDPGFRIKTVVVDGLDAGRLQNVTFESMTANHTVVAEFEAGTDYFNLESTVQPVESAYVFRDRFDVPDGGINSGLSRQEGTAVPAGGLHYYVAKAPTAPDERQIPVIGNGRLSVGAVATNNMEHVHLYTAAVSDPTDLALVKNFYPSVAGSRYLIEFEIDVEGTQNVDALGVFWTDTKSTGESSGSTKHEFSMLKQKWDKFDFRAEGVRTQESIGSSGAHRFRLVVDETTSPAGYGFYIDGALRQSGHVVFETDERYLVLYGSGNQAGNTDGWIDDLTLKRIAPYDDWEIEYGLVGGAYGDDDGDGLLNLHEYGLGGDPTNAADIGYVPAFGPSGSGMDLVHAIRNNDPSLHYWLETTTNLISGAWTNSGYTVVGTNTVPGNFHFVTNAIPMDGRQKFIRLMIK